MDQTFVTVHRADPDDTETLAVVHPGGRISGTDDPALTRSIQAALDDDRPFFGPDWTWRLHGPAGQYTDLEWACCVLSGLLRQGLRGDPVGFTWPEPEYHPDRTY